jgi:hypothetical protein
MRCVGRVLKSYSAKATISSGFISLWTALHSVLKSLTASVSETRRSLRGACDLSVCTSLSAELAFRSSFCEDLAHFVCGLIRYSRGLLSFLKERIPGLSERRSCGPSSGVVFRHPNSPSSVCGSLLLGQYVNTCRDISFHIPALSAHRITLPFLII